VTVYAWPAGDDWCPNRFEMRVLPNTRVFVGPYTPTTQVLDLLGERWAVSLDLPPRRSPILGAAREAFFDRLKGPANQVALSYLPRSLPQGTLRDGGGSAQWKTASATNATWQTNVPSAATWSYTGVTLFAAVAVGANVLPLSRAPGATVLAGDHIGVGGQLFRAMVNATADSAGQINVEVQPRARVAMAIGSSVNCTAPTANFILKAEGVPTVWRPGMFEGASLELIEAI
jgi:hypothetical protein